MSAGKLQFRGTVDKSGELTVLPLIYLGLQVYSAFTLGYTGGEVLSRDVLFRDNYSTPERTDARYMFGFNVMSEVAGGGLNTAQGAFLILAPDTISIFENSTGAAEERKRREEQHSQSRANASITNTSSSVGSGSGSIYNYIYSKSFGSPAENSRPQGIMGSYNFSSAQQGALQNFVNAVNAKNFDAQTFVSALHGVVSAFSVK